MDAIFAGVPEEPVPSGETEEAPAEHRVYRPGDHEGFHVQRLGDGTFRVSGGRVERLIARHDMDNDDAQRYVGTGCARWV